MKVKVVVMLLAVLLLFTSCVDGNDTVSGNLSQTPSAEDSSSTLEKEESAPAEESENSNDILSKEPENTFPEYEPGAPDVPDVPDESLDVDNVTDEECRVTVKYASFSEKPNAVVIGKCDIGATVTLKCGNKTYTSESWYGWYSVRFLCAANSAEVEITQTIDGKKVGTALSTTVKPVNAGTAEGVVAGDNFQFFYRKCLRDFQHTNLYSRGVLDNLKKRIEGRISNLENTDTDTEIIYMVVPAAMTMYPELVPDDYEQGQGESRLDQVLDTIVAAGATVIDLRTAFEEHKNDEYSLYFKCDSHWTDYGAFIAYRELFNHIAEKFPDAAPRGFDEFIWHGGYYKTGDMPVYLNMVSGSVYENGYIGDKDVLEYGWYRTFASGTHVSEEITEVPRYRADVQMVYSTNVTWGKTIRTNRDNLPSCIVLRDSFGTQIFDILAERMDKTVYKGMWDYTYYGAELVTQKPDYLIYILAEWNLDSIVYN